MTMTPTNGKAKASRPERLVTKKPSKKSNPAHHSCASFFDRRRPWFFLLVLAAAVSVSSIAENSLKLSYRAAERFRVIQYWRPIVPGLNDADDDIAKAIELSRNSHATVFTGLFYREEIKKFYQENGLPEPYIGTARRKIFPENLENRIVAAFTGAGEHKKLFRKTSCAVGFAHGVTDYNGHYGIKELCDFCPNNQVKLCSASHRQPDDRMVAELLGQIGKGDCKFLINNRAIEFESLDEQHRYFLQHSLGYQVHDRNNPHKFGRHGRADIGWSEDATN